MRRRLTIKVTLDRVSAFLYPGRDDLAVVSFDQDYASSNLVEQDEEAPVLGIRKRRMAHTV